MEPPQERTQQRRAFWSALGVAAALLVALFPAVLVALLVLVLAWRRAWSTAYLLRHAAWAWIIPVGVALWAWDWREPFAIYIDGMRSLWSLDVGGAIVALMVWAIPLGWSFATAWWMWWTHINARGTGLGVNAEKAEAHKQRRRRNEYRRARKEAQQDWLPLTKRGDIVLGTRVHDEEEVTRNPLDKAVRARHQRELIVPWLSVRQHMCVMADPGAGKTVMLTRLSVGATAEAWRRHAAGETDRPLTISFNCKAELKEALTAGWEWLDAMSNLGISRERMGMWPVDPNCRLNMWELPPDDLEAALMDLCKDDGPEHYAVLRETMLHLVVSAPRSGAPKSSAEFLGRINELWLQSEWAGYPVETEAIKAFYNGRGSEGRDILLKYYNLFRKLGTSLDAGHSLEDLDALYVAVDGGGKTRRAAAQVSAVIRLIKSYLVNPANTPRSILINLDEFSAISAEMGNALIAVVEQFRSLGGSVIVVAQSWEGFGATEDERYRLVQSCAGGRLLMRSTNPGKMAELCGTKPRPEISSVISGGKFTGDSSMRMQDTWVVNPQEIRELNPGELIYAHHGGRDSGVVAQLDMRAGATIDVGDYATAIQARDVSQLGPAMTEHKLLAARADVIEQPNADGPDRGSDPEGFQPPQPFGEGF